MAHNAFIRAGAVWADASTLMPSELSAFDTRQFQAINGDLGGVWSPSASITIGGTFGLRVTAPSDLDDANISITNGKAITIQGGASFLSLGGSSVTFGGDVTFTATTTHVVSGAVFFVDHGATINLNGAIGLGSQSLLTSQLGSLQALGGAMTITSGGTFALGVGSTMTANGFSTIQLANNSTTNLAGAFHVTTGTLTCDVGGNIAVNGTCTVNHLLTCATGSTTTFASGSILSIASGCTASYGATITGLTGSNLTTLGTITVQSAGVLAVDGALNRTGVETLSGPLAYRNVRSLNGTNGDQTYDARQFDVLVVPFLGASVIWTLSDLGPFDYVVFTIDAYRVPLTQNIVLSNGIGGLITTMFASDGDQSMTLSWNGSAWSMLSKCILNQ